MRTSNWWVHLLLIAASAIAVFPVLWILSTSFKPRSEVFSTELAIVPQTFTWENYVHVLTRADGVFLQWMANSFLVALLTALVALSLSATAAYALSRFRFSGKRVISFSFFLTQMFPGALLIVPLYRIVNALGLLNSYLGLVLAYATVAVPFCVMMLKNFFDTIPYELEEAARVDGLSPFGTFYRIVLPLSLPGIAVTGFFAFITAWNEFLIALTFMSEQRMYTLPIGLQQFVNQFNSDWHYMAAGAIIVTLPVLIVFLLAQRYLIAGLSAGGTKG
ncbi:MULTISPECIES: carbohydrate ABC transporter permease [Bacillales]|jgi:arabinogalactan oligomer/maltooligosaccharide transport system permease protein|uniref:ABC transporter permease n=1 Tax=Brevibacillus aydinogluensis TaxID=927786 RepID=A0AA48RGH2_9BACL|nr:MULTISPECIES: carbohydrate ABC transporter permease [Bacillales]REK65090.1 MAG: ABC transporter permease [Brevibacillus sp.]MBR8661636.1 carbohydrate ABC transporter permease [Brevibacillus sp. NL20B1]MDT3415946.1 arabinogalactan oligomer/maltooligosaccharide transport system permease protein [Brevibacillus aydinogluensis]NNV03131.1 carbohydrate ABC transporter permease [Brevibacillus sp. MCWH]UFJ61501.1 carbohydrate ABC transporter permease [Anoxybacillus sediminis]